MDNPVVYIGAALVLMGISFYVGRVTSRMDRSEAQLMASRLLRVEHTRGMLNTYVSIVEAHASGDGSYLYALNERLQSDPYPRFDALIISDHELVELMTVEALRVWERGFGESKDLETVRTVGRIRAAVKRAMDNQERRVIDGHEPIKISPDGAERLTDVLPKVLIAFSDATKPAPTGSPSARPDNEAEL